MTYIGLNGGQKQVAVSDLNTRTHLITFFDSKYAPSKDEEAWTLPDLAGEIQERSARSKAKLPWLKMARFGDVKSERNCFRYNANTKEITGTELDYDAGAMPFDDAVEAFRAVNLRVLLYTSASYIAGSKERWRVLAPLSEALDPARRKDITASVNAIIGGVATGESFPISTAFYYGCVKGKEAGHRVEVLDGDFIDLRPDLLANKAYPPKIVKPAIDRPPAAQGVSPGRDEGEIEGLLKASRKMNKHGERQWHNSMLQAVASMIGKGWTDAQIHTACQDYCNDGWGDKDIAELIRGGREKWQVPDADKVMGQIAPIVAAAIEATGYVPAPDAPVGATREDYYAFLPTHQYIYKYTGRLYPLASINATLSKVTIGSKPKRQGKKQIEAGEEPEMVAKQIPAALWLDRNRAVMEMTWAPGERQLLEGLLASEGGWIERGGVSTYNLYRPPVECVGDPANAWRWVDLVETIYPEHADHIIGFCAHRVQRPQEKINHALVLTGSPGIGKDTLLEPLKHGVGPWNFREIAPHDITGSHNDFMQSVVLRVSETRDLGDINRYGFYEATKTMTAAPPDMTRINVKYIPQFYVPNVTGVIFTTNYPTDGLYLPPDDRRHYVCGTELVRDETWDRYCIELWKWYAAGGMADVIVYLREYDLTQFDAKQPPVKTAAFWRMVDAGRPSEESELRDTIERMGNPNVLTIDLVMLYADTETREWMRDRKNNRNVSRRLDDCCYVPVRNPDNRDDGRWRVNNKNQVIYGRKDIPTDLRFREAEKFRKKDGKLEISEKE